MDYAILVSDFLNASDVGAVSYLDVPSDRPDEFCVVELTGMGAPDAVMRTPSVDVDCWAQTRARAAEIADSVVSAVLGMPDEIENVFGASVTSCYNNPDLESDTPRYTVGVSVTANE